MALVYRLSYLAMYINRIFLLTYFFGLFCFYNFYMCFMWRQLFVT